MQKKITDALWRADKIVVSIICLTLTTAGAGIAYAPPTDQPAVAVAVPHPVALPTAAQIVAADVNAQVSADMSAPPAAAPRVPAPSEMAALQALVKTECLADAMYYEARGEGREGELAIAEVVYNRMRDGNYPRNICGVVFEGSHQRTGCQFSFTCNGEMLRPKSPVAWRQAERLAARIVTGMEPLGDMTGEATSFHAVDVQPGWSGTMERTTQIGNHIFYRPARRSFTRGA